MFTQSLPFRHRYLRFFLGRLQDVGIGFIEYVNDALDDDVDYVWLGWKCLNPGALGEYACPHCAATFIASTASIAATSIAAATFPPKPSRGVDADFVHFDL